MVRINLFPKKPRPPITLMRDAMFLMGAFLATILITGQISMGLTRKINKQMKEKKEVEEGIAITKKKLKNINEIKEKIKDIDRKIAVINELKENQAGPVALFRDFSIATPQQLWINSLKNEGSSLKIEGCAFTPNTVSEFMQNLSKSPYFVSVELNNISQKKQQNKKVQVFSINCKTRYKLDDPKKDTKEPVKEEKSKNNNKKKKKKKK